MTPDQLLRDAEDAIELWFCELDGAHADIVAGGERRAQELVAAAEAHAEALTSAARDEAEELVGSAHVQARRIVEEAVAVAERLRNDAASDIAHLRLVVATLESELTNDAAERGISIDITEPSTNGTNGDDDAGPSDGEVTIDLTDGASGDPEVDLDLVTEERRLVGVTADDHAAPDHAPEELADDPPSRRRRGLRRLFSRSH